MNAHRASRDSSGPGNVGAVARRQATGSVILFIGAVVIAGLTCVLYLWQQSQIVATQGDIRTLDAKIAALTLQKNDLAAQQSLMTSVTHVLSEAVKDGMVAGDSRQVEDAHGVRVRAQRLGGAGCAGHCAVVRRPPVDNAAITTWWQGAWDGLFSLLQ